MPFLSVPTPKSTFSPIRNQQLDRLGTYIHAASISLSNASSWSNFIEQQQGPPDLQQNIQQQLSHPAAPFLSQVAKHGIPILLHTPPWSHQRLDAAMSRGSHPSTKEHRVFLRNEMADMIEQKHWIVIPYSQAVMLPMGVVPQRDRRPRIIVDYTFSLVNQDTLITLAPAEAMQFGHALDRILHKIYHANRRFGPVHLIKVDVADGFYRIRVAPSHMPVLGVSFPSFPGEEPLVAIPLVLPMGWVSSPPFFCAVTETAADIANLHLQYPNLHPSLHPLSTVADTASNFQPVSRHPLPAASMNASTTLSPSPRLSIVNTLVDTSVDRPLPKSSPQLHAPSPTNELPPSVPVTLHSPQPNQLSCPLTPLAYVDLYMDDFLGLAQGHPGLRERVRSTLFHSIDQLLRPLDHTDKNTSRREPISTSKLDKGDAKWSTRKCLLGWIIDTVQETIELPEHRRLHLLTILSSLLTKRRVSLKSWQQSIGELQSMILAIPGGQGFFSAFYNGLSQSTTSDHRIRITHPIRNTLEDLHHLALDLTSQPTRLGEVVDTLPVAYSAADACGLGMGGIWLSTANNFSPILWWAPFPTNIQVHLVTSNNRSGSITNSDLELSAQIATQDILLQVKNCTEVTLSTFTDNLSARAWQRKGSKATDGPAAYLLRLHALLQRHYHYRSTIDYIPGPINVMADDASRLWHLSDDSLLFISTLHTHRYYLGLYATFDPRCFQH
jgi:hypothetical protein